MHTAFDDRPSAEDREPGAEHAAVVEFAVREDMTCLRADGGEVFLGPAFLETYDVWDRRRRRRRVGMAWCGVGYEVADVGEALAAVLGEVEEAPAVEGEDVDLVVGGGG